MPSSGPKLPDLECAALLSDPPLAEAPWIALGRPFFNETSYGCDCKLPFGVASCNLGRAGRPELRAAGGCGDDVCRESAGVLRERVERSGMLFTGCALGDGGIARPSRGGRPVVFREPGIGGRRSGAGLDMYGASRCGCGCGCGCGCCCCCWGLIDGYCGCQRAVGGKGGRRTFGRDIDSEAGSGEGVPW